MLHPWQLTTQLIIFQHKKIFFMAIKTEAIYQIDWSEGILHLLCFFRPRSFVWTVRALWDAHGARIDSGEHFALSGWWEEEGDLLPMRLSHQVWQPVYVGQRAGLQQVQDFSFLMQRTATQMKMIFFSLLPQSFGKRECWQAAFLQSAHGQAPRLQAPSQVALSCSAAKGRTTGLPGRYWLLMLERFSHLLFTRNSYPTGVVQLHRALLKHTVNLLLSCVFQS